MIASVHIAGPEHSAQVATFLAQTMPTDWRTTGLPGTDQIRRVLKAPGAVMVLAVHEDTIVGLASGWRFPTVTGTGDTVMLDELLVAPSHQRSGVGTALTQRFLAAAKEPAQRPVQIWATTDTPDEPSRRAFERAGGIRGELFRQFDWPMEASA